MPRSDLGTML